MESPRRPVRTAPVMTVVLLALIVLAGLTAGVLATTADDDDPGFLAGPAELTDDVAIQIRDGLDGHGTEVVNLRDASNVVVDEASVPAGEVLPWHTHPGPLLIVVAEGEFTYVLADDCVEREYREGEALIDPGGDTIHTAFNPQDDAETVLVATYLGVPDDGELTTLVDEEEAEELDDECDIDTPSPG